MGIRFRCHQCGHELHVKDFQGGKRSKCPECEAKFRIPVESVEYSIPLENSVRDDSAAPQDSSGQDSSGPNSSGEGSSLQSLSSGTALETLPANPTLANASSPVRNSESEPVERAQNDAPQEIDSVSEPQADNPAQPQAILEAPGATWYVRPPAGGQYGPAPANIFCAWMAENRVTRDSLVWRDGWPQWLVASDVFTDYFGTPVPQTSAPVLGPTAVSSVPPNAEQTSAPEFIAPVSLSDRALAARKRQRKKNYAITIGILVTISVGLVIALVVVLMRTK